MHGMNNIKFISTGPVQPLLACTLTKIFCINYIQECIRTKTSFHMGFLFVGPCIFIYEDHISNQRDATFYDFY